jgi:hypothetical protein
MQEILPAFIEAIHADYDSLVAAIPTYTITALAKLAANAEHAGEQATRVSALAYREAGKKLLAIPAQRGARTDLEPREGTSRSLTREQAADQAGFTEWQRRTACTLGGMPEALFTSIFDAPRLTLSKLMNAARRSPTPEQAIPAPVFWKDEDDRLKDEKARRKAEQRKRVALDLAHAFMEKHPTLYDKVLKSEMTAAEALERALASTIKCKTARAAA